MIFHSKPKLPPNPWESQLLKWRGQETFVLFVPCSTSCPFFPMPLMPLWFLVLKGLDLLHANVYTCTPVKLSVKLRMYVFFKKKKHMYVYHPKPASFFMKACLLITSLLISFCTFQIALQALAP